jgi:hypothetical protein
MSKVYPNLLNAHSKCRGSCSIYIIKARCVALGAYMIKYNSFRHIFLCTLSNLQHILNVYRATLCASLMSLEQQQKCAKLGISQ